MNNVKLCIAGEFRSGKTTVADYLEKHYGATPFAFGDELKRGFHSAYPHIPVNPKPRKGYQLYGQLMRYVNGEEYWLNKCFNKIEDVEKIATGYGIDTSKFVPMITDARQPNEFEACKEKGYVIIKVLAPESVRIDRALAEGDKFTPEELEHETEQHVRTLDADFTIVNNASLKVLYKQIDQIVETILGKKKEEEAK